MLTETHRYMEYDIPVDLINLTGGGPDTFALISEQHIHHIQQYVGIKSTDNVVEVGCGIGRDAIPLTMLLGKGGQYLGIDIIARSINWCSANISKRHPNFRFVHFDVADQLHNPSGTLPISACHLPLPPGSVDLIILQSVFTHMFADGMTSYMTEFARV